MPEGQWLEALTERCGHIRDERARVMDRLSQLQHQQLEQAQHETLGQTLDEFCRKMSDVLDNPSFETKQRILRLVVDKILVDVLPALKDGDSTAVFPSPIEGSGTTRV